jgi:hypothetical protein
MKNNAEADSVQPNGDRLAASRDASPLGGQRAPVARPERAGRPDSLTSCMREAARVLARSHCCGHLVRPRRRPTVALLSNHISGDTIRSAKINEPFGGDNPDRRTVLDGAAWKRLLDVWACGHLFMHNDGFVDAKCLTKVPRGMQLCDEGPW